MLVDVSRNFRELVPRFREEYRLLLLLMLKLLVLVVVLVVLRAVITRVR